MQVSEGANRSCQDKNGRRQSPDKWAKSKCHDKLSYGQLLCFSPAMKPNGPAIKGMFLPSRYKVLWALRVSPSLIGASNLSPVTNLGAGTGPAKAGIQTISEPEICQGAGF
jgi:hypothetical protein